MPATTRPFARNLILGKYFALHRIDFAHTGASSAQVCVCVSTEHPKQPFSHFSMRANWKPCDRGFIRMNKHKSFIIASMRRHDTFFQRIFICVRRHGYIFIYLKIFDQIEFERKRELLFSSILICNEIAIRPRNLYWISHYVFNWFYYSNISLQWASQESHLIRAPRVQCVPENRKRRREYSSETRVSREPYRECTHFRTAQNSHAARTNGRCAGKVPTPIVRKKKNQRVY